MQPANLFEDLSKAVILIECLKTGFESKNTKEHLNLAEKGVRFVLKGHIHAFAAFLAEMETDVKKRPPYRPKPVLIDKKKRKQILQEAKDSIVFIDKLTETTKVLTKLKTKMAPHSENRIIMLLVKNLLLFITCRTLDKFRDEMKNQH